MARRCRSTRIIDRNLRSKRSWTRSAGKRHEAIARLASSLDCAGGEARNDIPLCQEEHDNRRQDGEGDEGEHELPLCRILALVGHEAKGPRVFRIAVEDDERQEIAVPAVDEGDDSDRRKNRAGERQGYIEEVTEVATSVHQSGVQKLGRKLLERTAEEEEAERQ